MRFIMVALGIMALAGLVLWVLLWWPLSKVEWGFVVIAGLALVSVTAGLVWERPPRH